MDVISKMTKLDTIIKVVNIRYVSLSNWTKSDWSIEIIVGLGTRLLQDNRCTLST